MIDPNKSPHFKALKQLYPLQMDAEEYAVALELDRALAYADEAYNEISPSSAVRTLAMWEKLYELDGTGTIEDRRQALLAKYNRDSGIAEKHYKVLALLMGYNVTIIPPKRLFRVGVSHLGEPMFDPDEQYTWTVVCGQMLNEIIPLVEAFEENKIPFTTIRWEVTKLAAFELEDGSLLELENGRVFVLENSAENASALMLEDGRVFELENGKIFILE